MLTSVASTACTALCGPSQSTVAAAAEHLVVVVLLLLLLLLLLWQVELSFSAVAPC